MAERLAALEEAQASRLAPFAGDTHFANVRQLGTITALDLKVPDAGYLAAVGPRLTQFFLERGVVLRPLGNAIYVMPPYCITPPELDRIYAAIAEAPQAVEDMA
jgi:adenosylmethionine-8-amino-7-oxononanoate aminotransferase